MPENPYRSPGQAPIDAQPNSSRFLLYGSLWIALFLMPAISLAIFRTLHLAQFLERPSGDTILSRTSIIISMPVEPLLLISLLGYVTLTVCSPINVWWKGLFLVAWIPFVILQYVALIITLILLGENWSHI